MLQTSKVKILFLFILVFPAVTTAQITNNVKITIVNSELTKKLFYQQNNLFNPIYDWEIFFLNHKVSYEVIDDTGLDNFDFRDTDVLILPSVEVLSQDAMENLSEYLNLGGSALILGKLGEFDELGKRMESDFLFKISGIKAELLPDQTNPSHELSINKSNILNNSSFFKKLLIPNRLPTYYTDVKFLSDKMLARFNVSDEKSESMKFFSGASFSKKYIGNIIWFGFQLSQIASLEKEENILSEIIINSINWLARKPKIWVNLLPGKNKSSVLFTFYIQDIKAFNKDILPVLEFLRAKSNLLLNPNEIIKSTDELQALSAVGEIIIYYDKLDMLNKSKDEIENVISNSARIIREQTNQSIVGTFLNNRVDSEEFNLLMNNNSVDFIIDQHYRIYLNEVDSKTSEIFKNFEYGNINFLSGFHKELLQIFDDQFVSELEYSDIINIKLPSENYPDSDISASEIIKECFGRITSKENWITSYSNLIDQISKTNHIHSEIKKSAYENLLTLKISNSSDQVIEKVGLFLSIPFSHSYLGQINYYSPPRFDYITGLYSLPIPTLKPFQTLFIDLRYD